MSSNSFDSQLVCNKLFLPVEFCYYRFLLVFVFLFFTRSINIRYDMSRTPILRTAGSNFRFTDSRYYSCQHALFASQWNFCRGINVSCKNPPPISKCHSVIECLAVSEGERRAERVAATVNLDRRPIGVLVQLMGNIFGYQRQPPVISVTSTIAR